MTRLSVRSLRETTRLTLPQRDCVSSNPWENRVVEVIGALQNPKVVRLWGTGIAVGGTPVKR